MIKSPHASSDQALTRSIENELLIKEARRRQRWFRTSMLGVIILLGISIFLVTDPRGPASTTPPSAAPQPKYNSQVFARKSSIRLLECDGRAVVRPTNFVIACGDGNTAVTNTHWMSWSSTIATGTTTFVVNLCVPYCAASPFTTIKGARIELFHPVKRRSVSYFTSIVVRYTLNGRAQQYRITDLPTHPITQKLNSSTSTSS
jgi:predicted nucleic acid-binding Zn ribbon protein